MTIDNKLELKPVRIKISYDEWGDPWADIELEDGTIISTCNREWQSLNDLDNAAVVITKNTSSNQAQ